MLLNQPCKKTLKLLFLPVMLIAHSITNFCNVIMSFLLLGTFLKLLAPLAIWLFENLCFIYVQKSTSDREKWLCLSETKAQNAVLFHEHGPLCSVIVEHNFFC